jgi:hypothetical protein
LATDDANVAVGQTLTVNGAQLRSNEKLPFDGSAEMDAAKGMKQRPNRVVRSAGFEAGCRTTWILMLPPPAFTPAKRSFSSLGSAGERMSAMGGKWTLRRNNPEVRFAP